VNNHNDFNNNQFRAQRAPGQMNGQASRQNTQIPRQQNPAANPRPVNSQNPQRVPSQRTNPQQPVQRQSNPANPRNDVSRQVNPQRPRRPLTDEERRRLEAARQAGTRVNLEDEARRRRSEQAQLSAAQASVAEMHRQALVSQNIPQPQRQQQKKKKKKVRINAGLVLFVLLISGVIGISVYQINKNSEDNTPDVPDYSLQNKEEETDLPAETDALEEVVGSETETSAPESEDPVNLNLYDTVTVKNTSLDEGDLILVNYQYAYADADTIALSNIYNDRTIVNTANSRKLLRVSRSDTSMTPKAFAALEQLAVDLREETGDENLLINSGHRGTASQQSVWDNYMAQYGEEYTKSYVAVPGYSEHHTGLACDLGFYTDDGATISVADYEYGWWLGANCARRGFILRYPEDKVGITGIAYEKWHFRYVGIPHAYAIDANNLCLEEYIDFIKTYTADGKMLHVKTDRSVTDVDVTAAELPKDNGWLLYYVPMTEGESTEIRIPRDAQYEISGNNVDGYIVTITLDE